MQPTEEDEILVTSFTTHGTPLVRYRIGDSIKITSTDLQCSCRSQFPIVEKIEWRATDYILSPTHGKVNLGNISNSTKDINGIINFQVIQKELAHVSILVTATKYFTNSQKKKVPTALKERFGPKMSISLKVLDEIPTEKSGKFRIVKN